MPLRLVKSWISAKVNVKVKSPRAKVKKSELGNQILQYVAG